MNHSSRKTAVALAIACMVAAPLAFAQSDTDPAGQAAQPTAQASGGNSWNDVDTDGDGAISQSEAGAVPALAQVYTQADANADGALTADEYQAFVAQAQAEAAAGSTAADASGHDDAARGNTDLDEEE